LSRNQICYRRSKEIYTHSLHVELTEEDWGSLPKIRERFRNELETRFGKEPTNNELIRRMIRYFAGAGHER
jgi:hypothetical protein